MESDFPANSNRHKQQQKPDPKKLAQAAKDEKVVEQVVEAAAVSRRKKPLGSRIRANFGGQDGKTVVSYVIMDVLRPGFKAIVYDAGQEALSRAMFGESRPPGRKGSGAAAPSRFSYDSVTRPAATQRREDPRPQLSKHARTVHDFDEILFEKRIDGLEVLDQMNEMISKYEEVSVADLYGMVGQKAHFTDNKWGWYDLRGSDVIRTRSGVYLLDIPKPVALD